MISNGYYLCFTTGTKSFLEEAGALMLSKSHQTRAKEQKKGLTMNRHIGQGAFLNLNI